MASTIPVVRRRVAIATATILLGVPAASPAVAAPERTAMATTSPAVAAYAKRYQAFRTTWNPRVARAQKALDEAVNSARFPAIRDAFAAYATLVRANRTAFLRLRAPAEIRPQVTALSTAVARLATAADAGAKVTGNSGLIAAIQGVNDAVARAGVASIALRKRVGLPS